MRRLVIAAFALSAVATPVVAADPVQARQIVSDFLAAVDRGDRRATKMISADALIGAGDVGDKMTIDVFPMKKLGCKLGDINVAAKQEQVPGRDIVVVDSNWTCPGPEAGKNHLVTLKFFVDGQHIAGAWLK